MPSTKRRAEDEVSSLVSELHFAGMYQPMSVVVDDEDVHHYVPSAAFHLVLSLVWDDAGRRTGNVRGDVYWKYGLIWDSLQAVDNEEQLFWPVARQTESVVGRVQRRVESRGVRGASEQQSRGSCLLLSLHTLRLGVIDASLSSFSDSALRASEQEHSQVEYALDKFERERNYTLSIDDDTPQLMEGEVSRRFAQSERPVGESGKEEEEEEAEEDSNEPTHIRAWDCTAEYAKYEDDEFALVSSFHSRIVDEFRVVLQSASVKAVSIVSKVLRNVVGDPVELKYRAVNPAKVDRVEPRISELLKHCGFRETFMLEKNATFFVLPDDADLLLLSLLIRALDSRAMALRAQEEATRAQEEPIVLE